MIDRAAVMLRYKAPAVAWINDADPTQGDSDITMESVNEDRTVYLIREAYADTPGDFEEWLRMNYEALFESELESWYSDEGLWPKDRSLTLFREWFDVECCTEIVDTVGSAIQDDEA